MLQSVLDILQEYVEDDRCIFWRTAYPRKLQTSITGL